MSQRPYLPGSPGNLLYNLFLGTAILSLAPVWIPWTLFSRKRRANLPERLGLRGLPERNPGDGRPVVWVHAVSVGETIAAVPLLKLLRRRVPNARMLVSNVTRTGRDTAQRFLSGVADGGFYFPFDLPGLCGGIIDRVCPDVVAIVETEIWPNFIAACAARRIPVVIVNGRLSKRSFSGYMRLRAFFAPILRTLSAICAQTSDDAERFLALGAPSGIVTVGGNLKFDVEPPGNVTGGLLEFLLREKRAGTVWIVAGSTHEGEEAAILRAFLAVRDGNPSIRLVIAPRHPERFDAVEALLQREGVPVVRRTGIGGGESRFRSDVLLLDTVGELPLAYAAADLAFVGGSLVPKGGHNVIEPAWHGVPAVVGPYMENFREISDAFLSGNALIRVGGEEELKERLERFAKSPEEFREVGRRGKAMLESFRGASESNAAPVIAALGRRYHRT